MDSGSEKWQRQLCRMGQAEERNRLDLARLLYTPLITYQHINKPVGIHFGMLTGLFFMKND